MRLRCVPGRRGAGRRVRSQVRCAQASVSSGLWVLAGVFIHSRACWPGAWPGASLIGWPPVLSLAGWVAEGGDSEVRGHSLRWGWGDLCRPLAGGAGCLGQRLPKPLGGWSSPSGENRSARSCCSGPCGRLTPPGTPELSLLSHSAPPTTTSRVWPCDTPVFTHRPSQAHDSAVRPPPPCSLWGPGGKSLLGVQVGGQGWEHPQGVSKARVSQLTGAPQDLFGVSVCWGHPGLYTGALEPIEAPPPASMESQGASPS